MGTLLRSGPGIESKRKSASLGDFDNESQRASVTIAAIWPGRRIVRLRLATRACVALPNPRARDVSANTLGLRRRHSRSFDAADNATLPRVILRSSLRRLRRRHRAEQEEHQRSGESDSHQSRVTSSPLRLEWCAPPSGRTLLTGGSAASTIRAAAPRTNEAPASSRNARL